MSALRAEIRNAWGQRTVCLPRDRAAPRNPATHSRLCYTRGSRRRPADLASSVRQGPPTTRIPASVGRLGSCLGGKVERSITGEHLIAQLDRLAAERGTYPAVLRCDNGPELACSAMADWAAGQVGLHFIPPGEPSRNGYVESFKAVAKRLRRILQLPHPRRMLEHQQLLVDGPGPGGHQRLEARIQPPPSLPT